MALKGLSIESLHGSGEPAGRAVFWITQVTVWVVIHGVMFIPNQRFAVALGADVTHVLCQSVHSTVMAILLSTGLARIYERLPESSLRGPRAIATVFGLCALGSLLWLVATFATSPFFSVANEVPVLRENSFFVHLMFFIKGTMMLATWSAMFLLLLLGRRVQSARERAIYAASLVHEAQVQLLRSQLNPHFLFNALNSVVALISEEPKRAQAMVRDIATLLRRALDDVRNQRATLRDEIEFIELYLRCERVRFEDRLEVDIDVPDDLLTAPLPSMLLHPLVENAIKHGIQGRERLRLRITAHEEDGRVVLEVRNTGALAAHRFTPKPGTGMGLKSVRERLRSLFPKDGEFELSDGGGWVTARIQFTPTVGRAS